MGERRKRGGYIPSTEYCLIVDRGVERAGLGETHPQLTPHENRASIKRYQQRPGAG
jgi:hypothetical protein